MKNVYFEQKVVINDRQIKVLVTGTENSIKTNQQPFILFIAGGPGCSYKAFIPIVNKILAHAEKNHITPPNFIFFDSLGCGESDDAKDRAKEYTMANFNEIAAQVVEKTKAALNLKKMDLSVWGVSYGSMTAMCLPLVRPSWVNKESDIAIQQIIAESFCNGEDTWDHALELVDQLFKDHPRFTEIRKALERDLSGEAKEEELLDLSFMEAPIYADQTEKVVNSFAGKLVKKYPRFVSRMMTVFNKLIHADDMDAAIAMLNLNVSQAHHFCKNKYDHLNIAQLALAHRELYTQFPICFLSGAQDVIANPKYNAELIQPYFTNMASIVFNSKHQIEADRPEYIKIIHDLLFEQRVDQENLAKHSLSTVTDQSPAINRSSLPDDFLNQLAGLRSPREGVLSTSAKLQKHLHGTAFIKICDQEDLDLSKEELKENRFNRSSSYVRMIELEKTEARLNLKPS